MYVFTVLAILLQSTMWVITHTPDLKDGVTALLNIISGGLITQIGTVVSHEFREAKQQAASRATDTIDKTTFTSVHSGPPPGTTTGGKTPP